MKSPISALLLMLVIQCSGETIICNATQDSHPIILSANNRVEVEDGDEDTYYNNFFNLTCTASYPIEWDYEGDLPAMRVTVSRKRYSILDSSCYQSVLKINYIKSDGFSAEFICFSTVDPRGKRSAFHMFYRRHIDALFSGSLQTKVKRAQRTKTGKFLIPCPSNYEHANVSLVKLVGKNDTIALPLNSSVTYDPKAGFLLQSSEFPDPTGKYKCLGSPISNHSYQDYRDRFEHQIEILGSEDTVSFSPETEFPSFQNGSALHLVCESVYEIYLNTSLVPRKLITLVSSTQIGGSKFPYTLSIWINSTGASKGRITCHRNDTNALITSWEFNEAARCRCIWDNWLRQKRGDLLDPNGLFICTPNINNRAYLFNCKNPSECRLSQSTIKDSCLRLKKDCNSFLHFGPYSPQISFNRLNCDVDILSHLHLENITESTHKSIWNYNSDEGMATNFESEIRSTDLISIKLEDPNVVIRAKESYSFVCTFHSNILAQEILWGFKMKNGSLAYVNESKERETNSWVYTYSSYQTKLRKKIYIPDTNVDSMYCFASVWASGEILNSSVRITVYEAVGIVDDPKNCTRISDSPSIMLYTRNADGIFKFYNVTGKDFIMTDDHGVGQSNLICVSKHVAEWKFNGENFTSSSEPPSSPRTTSHGFSTKEMIRTPNSQDFCFINTLTIHLSTSLTIGNYSCLELRKNGKQSSMHLFIKVTNNKDSEIRKQDLIGHGSHETLIIDKSNEWTVIPCRVNDPETVIHLIRQDDEGNLQTLSEALNSSYMKPYNPKYGFMIKTSVMYTIYKDSDVYICSSVQNGIEDTEVNHVKTYELWFDDSTNKTYGDFNLTKDEEVSENDLDFKSESFAWLCTLLMVSIISILGLCFYTRKLRQELKTTGSSTAPVIFLKNDNASIPCEAIEQTEKTNYDQCVKCNCASSNFDYVQFE